MSILKARNYWLFNTLLLILYSSLRSNFCKEILPKMIGIGQMDKVEDIEIGKMDKSQSNLTPGVLASYMIH